jgi:hypothetical protein
VTVSFLQCFILNYIFIDMIKLKELLNEIEEACWDTHKQIGMKEKGGRMVPNCVKKEALKDDDNIEEYDVESEQDVKEFVQFMREYNQPLCEAEYQGRKVSLGKRMQGDVKKFKVYVKNPKGKVVKVNFGFGGTSAKGKRMTIKKNNPARRKNFRARHNCDNPGPRTKARYWSCRAW